MPESIGSARTNILERIRAASFSAERKARDDEYNSISRDYQQSSARDRTAILNTFAERLHEYDAIVREATLATLGTAIGDIAVACHQKFIILCKDVQQEWLPEGLSWRTESEADIDELNSADSAMVTCEVAIAHTGTIVLRGSRRATLLPDRLLCIVHEHQVVDTVPEAFARLQSLAADSLTFISGPSATADIEMTRIRGVHGPRFLDIVLVREEQPPDTEK